MTPERDNALASLPDSVCIVSIIYAPVTGDHVQTYLPK